MDAVFPRGFETPEGKSVGRAAEPRGVIVRGDLPMRLSVTGMEQRRSLVLILYESSRPHTVLAPDWTPRGSCRP